MNYGGGATAAAAAAAAIANAVKASGSLVEVETQDFLKLVNRIEQPAVVCATQRIFGVRYKYLTVYKGLFLYTKSKTPLQLPGTVERINAGKIWMPG